MLPQDVFLVLFTQILTFFFDLIRSIFGIA